MFESITNIGKEFAQGAAKKAISALLATGVVQTAINAKICKYASIHDLTLIEEGIEIQAQLAGSHDIVTATATQIDIDADKRTFCVHHFKSDMPWADHVLNDFVTNKPFPLDSLPPMAIKTLAGINSLLK